MQPDWVHADGTMDFTFGAWYLYCPPGKRVWDSRLVTITGLSVMMIPTPQVAELITQDERENEDTLPLVALAHMTEVERRAEGPVTLPAQYSGYYVADLCRCCYVALVNGDPCECADDTGQHPKGLMGRLDGAEVTPGLFAEEHDSRCLRYLLDDADVPGEYECECETETFSHAWCDGCGSTLHGERHKATGWILAA